MTPTNEFCLGFEIRFPICMKMDTSLLHICAEKSYMLVAKNQIISLEEEVGRSSFYYAFYEKSFARVCSKFRKNLLGIFLLFAIGNAASYRPQQPPFVLLLPHTERAHSAMLQQPAVANPYLTL